MGAVKLKSKNLKFMIADLKEKINGKVVILGVGNVLKQDDGLGPTLIQMLNGKLKVELIDCGVAPENFTGKIRRLEPKTILIVDAVNFGLKPGKIKVVRHTEIRDETFTTHNISLKAFVDFIKNEIQTEVYIVGVQPKQVGFGGGLSEEVCRALERLHKAFTELLGA